MNRTRKLFISRHTVRSLAAAELADVGGAGGLITGVRGDCESHMATCGRATICVTRRLECPSRVEC